MRAAGAAESDERQYATLLRTINPHLQVHQSLAFAHAVVADAARANLDPRLIVALVTVESHWQPDAISRVGARGLGQLMPGTAATLGVNPWDPMQNIRGAATYVRDMLNRFAGRGANSLRYAIGAYNAGPAAVNRYHGVPPYHETQNYVRKVLDTWRRLKIHIGAAVPQAGAPSTTPDVRLWVAQPNASALSDTAAAAGSTATAPVTPAAPAAPAAPAVSPQTTDAAAAAPAGPAGP